MIEKKHDPLAQTSLTSIDVAHAERGYHEQPFPMCSTKMGMGM